MTASQEVQECRFWMNVLFANTSDMRRHGDKQLRRLRLAVAFLLFAMSAAAPKCHATEYLWKFTLPAMRDGGQAVAVYETLQGIPGVRGIDVNMDNFSVRFYYDDERAGLDDIQKAIERQGFPVQDRVLLQEPGMGLMN